MDLSIWERLLRWRDPALLLLSGLALLAGGLALALAARGSEQQALAGLAGYNPALAALAVSQVHRSWVVPMLAIIAAVLLRAGFDRLGLPPLTMPFIMACWLVALGQRWRSRRSERV